MSEINDTPAFPTENAYHVTTQHGMSMRDYFAAKAMQGLMSMERANEFVSEEDGVSREDGSGTLFVHTKYLAEEAYMIADAMLIVRAENE